MSVIYDFVDPVQFLNDFTVAALAQSTESPHFKGVSAVMATDRIGIDLSSVTPVVVIHLDEARPIDNLSTGAGAQLDAEWQLIVDGADLQEPPSALAVRLLKALVWATGNGTQTSEGVATELEVTSLPVPVLGLQDATLISYAIAATITVQKESRHGFS
jgi:hypothetical protein